MFTAAGKSAAVGAANYIEEVFSTYLWTGTGASQTITNGIDLSTKGGLVWTKARSSAFNHALFDTARGTNIYTSSNTTAANTTSATSSLTAFNTTGFNIGSDSIVSNTGTTFVGWTFRKQAKFFDVVTWTGDGTGGRQISHNLQSVPGFIVIKCTSTSATGWPCWHRGNGTTNYYPYLNLTSGSANSRTVTSTYFTVNNDGEENFSGRTYVAYLFAHNAGGFGASGSDNVITCGSVVGGALTTSVTLGYEPQWILMKNASAAQDWWLVDNMRGLPAPSDNARLLIPNKTDAEAALSVNIDATGFTTAAFSSGQTYIYIAIRRGPMKTPTTGTSVFSPKATQGPSSGSTTSSNPNYDAGFPVDLFLRGYKPGGISVYTQAFDRLRGINGGYLTTSSTAAETGDNWAFDSQIGVYNTNAGSNSNPCAWLFRRAPGFFDVVCYTGTGSALAVNHNLQVVPELVIWKARNQTGYGWKVTCVGLTNPDTYFLTLNATNAQTDNGANFIYNRTATTVTFAPDLTNAAYNNVVYLFATVAGVSKVGSYTGTGALQTVNCGFASGARFVLIKRTDSTGDWYVYDSARGITSGNDPYLLLNSTAAEVTGTNYVDTASTGFQITAAAPAGLNANGGTYIFLAIA